MTIHRPVKLVLAGVILLAAIVWGGWQLARLQLAEMGVERLEVSGVELGWDRLAFDSLRVTWSGNGRSVLLETLQPVLTMDWRAWQADRLTASSARVIQALPADPEVAARSGSPEALRLTFPDAAPFWLPRHLAVNELEAVFPCQDSQCQLSGALRLDRDRDSATAKVDVTLSRDQHLLAVEGDIQLGSGDSAAAATEGELTITGLQPWLADFGGRALQPLIPRTATLRFSPADGQGGTGEWPMTVSLTTEGGAAAAFEGKVVLDTADPWQLAIRHGQLTGRLQQWRQSGWLLEDLQAELPVSGTISADSVRLDVLQGARVQVRHLDPLEAGDLMWADDLFLSAEDLALSISNGGVRLTGPVGLSAGEVRHPALHTQAWQLRADLHWSQQLELAGNLTNAAGAMLPFRVRYRPDDGLEASASMTLAPDNQANYLAATLSAWPETLTLDGGQVEWSGRLRWAPGASAGAEMAVDFAEAAGVYERMAWQGLTGQVAMELDDGMLGLSSGDLVMDQLNPGVPLGPIRLAADYQASVEAPAQGRLRLAHAEAGFAGGTLSVPEQLWHLDEPPWQVPVSVQSLELSALMDLYPTEGLAGEGLLQGELPLTIGGRGLRIENGRLFALPPGGRLQLPADKLQGLAGTNEAMALVARAMEDFRYQHLESDIRYTEDGTLVLDLQLRGSSPKVDSERPVVLNINLEEDIPALLTSLQLSGRVNEAVTRRVRERLQRENAGPQ